jgi:hypothetical protein
MGQRPRVDVSAVERTARTVHVPRAFVLWIATFAQKAGRRVLQQAPRFPVAGGRDGDPAGQPPDGCGRTCSASLRDGTLAGHFFDGATLAAGRRPPTAWTGPRSGRVHVEREALRRMGHACVIACWRLFRPVDGLMLKAAVAHPSTCRSGSTCRAAGAVGRIVDSRPARRAVQERTSTLSQFRTKSSSSTTHRSWPAPPFT